MNSSKSSVEVASADAPANARRVLSTLIIVAAVANLPMAMANVALPSIGQTFNASQTQLNLVAVGYSLGLACSVLWLGALGDRYGRKQIAMLGVALAMPAALVSGYAPTINVLIFGRIFGGFAAGMAYPTTLALIAALWTAGPGRTRTIAVWAATGGAINAIGPLLSGLLLTRFPWSSVFLVVLPIAVIALYMAWKYIPSHVAETMEPVDNLGGILSLIFIGTLVLALNFAPLASTQPTLFAGLMFASLISLVLFIIRQRRARFPLYDLKIAARRTFWVAAAGGIIVFGSLMGAMFIGQQFMQNVLSYSTVQAGAAIIPAAIFMILAAPRSAILVESRGSRFTFLAGFFFVLLGFVAMLLLWKENIPYWKVALGYSFLGLGVGLAGTPSSRSLTGSVPVTKAGMASGTADLQRDLGGALFQSILGALLAVGYTTAMSASIAGSPQAGTIPPTITTSLIMSYGGAQTIAAEYPQYADQITAAAKSAFLAGDTQSYFAGILFVLAGLALVFFLFPKMEEERRMVAGFQEEDKAVEEVQPGKPETASAPGD